MCPGLDQVRAAGASSGVSQDKFWRWVPGLGEEGASASVGDLGFVGGAGFVGALGFIRVPGSVGTPGFVELLDLWELLPGSAGAHEFLGALGSGGAFRFFGDPVFLRARGFALSLE